MAAHAHTRAHAIQYCNNLCKLSYAPSGKHQKTLHGDRKATSVEKSRDWSHLLYVTHKLLPKMMRCGHGLAGDNFIFQENCVASDDLARTRPFRGKTTNRQYVAASDIFSFLKCFGSLYRPRLYVLVVAICIIK